MSYSRKQSHKNQYITIPRSNQEWRRIIESQKQHKPKHHRNKHQQQMPRQQEDMHNADSGISAETILITTLVVVTALISGFALANRSNENMNRSVNSTLNHTHPNYSGMTIFGHPHNRNNTFFHHHTMMHHNDELSHGHKESRDNIKNKVSFTHYSKKDVAVNESLSWKTVKLTRQNIGEIKILDFWGEGRIVEGTITTGFTNAYNVNHQHQKISNGKNRGNTIPAHIPTIDYENMQLDDLIADHIFQYVTVMGSPVISESAQEMYRIVRKDNSARIIFYGTENHFTDKIQIASQNDFIYMQYSKQYVDNLETQLKEPTIRPINLMVPIRLVLKDLKESIQKNDANTSVQLLLDLAVYCKTGYSQSKQIKAYVTDMLNESQSQFIEALKQQAVFTENAVIAKAFDIVFKKMSYEFNRS